MSFAISWNNTNKIGYTTLINHLVVNKSSLAIYPTSFDTWHFIITYFWKEIFLNSNHLQSGHSPNPVHRGLKKQLSPLIEWSRTRSIGSTFQDSICPAWGERVWQFIGTSLPSPPPTRLSASPHSRTLLRVATLPRFHLSSSL